MKTIKEVITLSTGYLEKAGVESARIEAEWLIGHVLDMKRIDLYMQFDKPLPESVLNEIRPLISRCAKGEPVQYICGETEFYSLPFKVGPGVLIPRPETELLVDWALKNIEEESQVLDLCTGSGCIAVALAKNKNVAVTATDISAYALNFARENSSLNNVTVNYLEGDLFAPVKGRQFDFICTNPPYVKDTEASDMKENVLGHEPHNALFAGDDGLDILRRISSEAGEFLNENGKIISEIGFSQGPAAMLLFTENNWKDVQILQDFSERDRFVVAVNKKSPGFIPEL